MFLLIFHTNNNNKNNKNSLKSKYRISKHYFKGDNEMLSNRGIIHCEQLSMTNNYIKKDCGF